MPASRIVVDDTVLVLSLRICSQDRVCSVGLKNCPQGFGMCSRRSGNIRWSSTNSQSVLCSYSKV